LGQKRNHFPKKPAQTTRHPPDEGNEYWSAEYLSERLYYCLSGTKLVIEYQDKKVTIRKYYNQALRLWKWIPISRPPLKFLINTSDLNSKLLIELQLLDGWTLDYVVKLAVGRIFEDIDSKYYRRYIAKRLRVEFDK
jgi:hypothetical protein